MNFPSEFVERIRRQFGNEATELLTALDTEPSQSIRLNPRKPIAAFSSHNVPWAAHGRYLTERPAYAQDPLFHAGAYYPQEASSMAVEAAYNEIKTPIQLALDLCAAPGGKSTHAISLLDPAAVLVSNEIVPKRFSILYENMVKWGYPNTLLTNHRPEHLARLGGVFDLVLVDAPCSGEGLFRKQKSWREDWTVTNCELCASRQTQILQSAIDMVRPGGHMIYSTCTMNPDENSKQINYLLQHNFEILPILSLIKANFHEIDGGYLALPHRIDGEPFFISLLRRKGDTALPTLPRNTTFEKIKIGALAGTFYQEKEDVFQLNDAQLGLTQLLKAARLRYKVPPIGTKKKSLFLPSHFLAMMNDTANPYPSLDLEFDEAIRYLKHESIESKPAEKGWHFVSYRGTSIGMAKYDGRRLINKYPIKWRLRK